MAARGLIALLVLVLAACSPAAPAPAPTSPPAAQAGAAGAPPAGRTDPAAPIEGAEKEQVILDDATLVHTRYGGVPVNSSAPNASTLLIVYLLSPEGQAALWKWNGLDLHLYPDSHTKAMVDKVKAAGGKFAVNSPQWLATFPDFTAQQQEIAAILQQ